MVGGASFAGARRELALAGLGFAGPGFDAATAGLGLRVVKKDLRWSKRTHAGQKDPAGQEGPRWLKRTPAGQKGPPLVKSRCWGGSDGMNDRHVASDSPLPAQMTECL